MTIRRRGRRIKLSRGFYLNTDANGNVSSTTQKSGPSTYTSFAKGGYRNTLNLGNGLSDVNVSRPTIFNSSKPKRVRQPARSRGRRSQVDEGVLLQLALAAAWIVAQAAWRLVSWSVSTGWRAYRDRRGTRDRAA